MAKFLQAENHCKSHKTLRHSEQKNINKYFNFLSNFQREVEVCWMTSFKNATWQTNDTLSPPPPTHPDADDHPLRYADKARNIKSLPYLETRHETSENGCDKILQKENKNNNVNDVSNLTSSEKP